MIIHIHLKELRNGFLCFFISKLSTKPWITCVALYTKKHHFKTRLCLEMNWISYCNVESAKFLTLYYCNIKHCRLSSNQKPVPWPTELFTQKKFQWMFGRIWKELFNMNFYGWIKLSLLNSAVSNFKNRSQLWMGGKTCSNVQQMDSLSSR